MSLKKQQQFAQAASDRKQRVRLYKAGKFWISMGITSAVLGLASFSTTTLAKADMVATNDTNTVQAGEATSDKAQSIQQPEVALQPTQTKPTAATNSENTTETPATQTNESYNQQASLTTSTDTTNLGSASSNEVEAAKAQAAQRYADTGDSQVVTASDPTNVASTTTDPTPTADTDTTGTVDTKTSTTADPLKEKVDGYHYQLESKTVTETVVKDDPVNGTQTDVQQVTFYRNKVTSEQFLIENDVVSGDQFFSGIAPEGTIIAAYEHGKLLAAEVVGEDIGHTIYKSVVGDGTNWELDFNQNYVDALGADGSEPVISFYAIDQDNLKLRSINSTCLKWAGSSVYQNDRTDTSATLTDDQLAQLQVEQLGPAYTEWTTDPSGFSVTAADQLNQISALTSEQLATPNGYVAEVQTKVYQRQATVRPVTPTLNAINAGDEYVTGTGTPGDIIVFENAYNSDDTYINSGIVNKDGNYCIAFTNDFFNSEEQIVQVYDVDPNNLMNVSDFANIAIGASVTHDQSNITASAPVDAATLAQLQNGFKNATYDGANDKAETTPSSDTKTNDNVTVDANTYSVVRNVTYYKVANPDESQTNANLVAHYVDEDGNTLQDDTTSQGIQGSSFEAKAATIDGYELTPTSPTDVKGTYTGNVDEVTFTYAKQPIAKTPDESQVKGTLVVHYVDEDGKTLQADTVSQGIQGSSFEAKAAMIDGYELTPASPTDVKGTYTGNVDEVAFTYAKQPIAKAPDESQVKGTLVVHYVDEKGNTLQVDTTSQGIQGSSFEAKAAMIDGYELTPTSPTDVKGTYHGNVDEVTFTYKQVPAKTTGTPTPGTPVETTGTPITPAPATPVDPEIPATPEPATPVETETPVTPTNDTNLVTSDEKEDAQVATRTVSQKAVTPTVKRTATEDAKPVTVLNNEADKLPQTSEQSSSLGALIGLSLMNIAGLVGLAITKRKRTDE